MEMEIGSVWLQIEMCVCVYFGGGHFWVGPKWVHNHQSCQTHFCLWVSLILSVDGTYVPL